MSRMLKTLGLALVLALVLTLALPAVTQAQVVIVPSSPVVVWPTPIVRSYSAYPAPVYIAPSITYSAPLVTAPRVSYYSTPVVTASVPVVSYSAPVVTGPVAVVSYSAPVVVSPGVYTTYTYRNGLGIFRPRYVYQSYYTPVFP